MHHSHNDKNLDSLCTFSNIPLINKIIGCRKVTIEEINLLLSLKEYWSNETNEDLCHYFYFPIADPYATKQLLLDNYLIMEKEIIKRNIDCKKDYRNVFWYRLLQRQRYKKHVKKLLERHSIPHPSDDEKNGKKMEINWIAVGWIIDMILNGFVWLIIAVLGLSLIDITDKWIRKTLKLMEKVDLWIREFIENLLEWILKKNFKILSGVLLLIILGVLAQLEIIPKLIT